MTSRRFHAHKAIIFFTNIYTKLVDGGLKNFRGETGYELLKYFETITRGGSRLVPYRV
jgi:hypothetical protein